LDRLTFGPWGEPLTGNFSRTRFGYTGHQREAKTGYWYSMWRYLDSRAGRWTQRDPLGDLLVPQRPVNRYPYVLSRPLHFTDPIGLLEDCEGEVVGGPCRYVYQPGAVTFWELAAAKRDGNTVECTWELVVRKPRMRICPIFEKFEYTYRYWSGCIPHKVTVCGLRDTGKVTPAESAPDEREIIKRLAKTLLFNPPSGWSERDVCADQTPKVRSW
jgi:RHS repeat-associated protein